MRDMFIGIFGYAKRYRLMISLLLCGLSLESFYDVGVRYSIRFIIDRAIAKSDLLALVLILGLLAAGAIAFNFIVVACDYWWARIGGKILNDIRFDLFTHMQSLPINFYRKQSAGDLTARFNADVGQINSGMVLAFPMAVAGTVEIITTLSLMLLVYPLLAAIAALGIVCSLVLPRMIQNKALDASFILRREEGRMMGFLNENMGGQSVIKAYCLEDYSSKDFSKRLDVLLSKLVRANFLSYMISSMPNLTFLALQLVVLGVGGWLAIVGKITLGGLVAYLMLLIGLGAAIYNLTWTLPSFIDASAGWRRICEILREPLGIQDKPDAHDLEHFTGSIHLENVTFTYPGAESPALSGVDLKINAGEYVLFVGRSGAGKSSLINLILRFYDVIEGRISLDGHDLRDVTMVSLRSLIGLVSQEIMLFDMSVRDNIRLGALDATDADIIEAAKAAEIHEFIMTLPLGYDTAAGTAGLRFSGGERQRIALARALVRKPAILILDEVASALDPTTETQILQTIVRLKGTCTILSITHRLTMAEDADKIVVMRSGGVVNVGTHESLIGEPGEYLRLWMKDTEDSVPGETEEQPNIIHECPASAAV